jgi:hypothetical protein
MAERQSMTIEEVVRTVMVDEHADVVRESVRPVVQQRMDAEGTGSDSAPPTVSASRTGA